MENSPLLTLDHWLTDPAARKLLFLFLGLVIIYVVFRFLRHAVLRYVHDNTTRYQARKSVAFFGFLTALLFVALLFSEKLSGFTVAFGVAGAGIAFALQEVIASVAGWVAVSFGGFYKVGDRVQLGGIKGDVIDIGILRTTIMEMGEWVKADQYNGRIVRVANSFVFKEPVYNYSGEFPFLWDEIIIPIKYGSDYHLARKLIKEIAEDVVGEHARSAQHAWQPITNRYLIETASVQPIVTLMANQNWIEFTLRYVVDYRFRRSTRDQLYTRLLDVFAQHATQVGIASSTLNIERLGPLEVHLTCEKHQPT